jgi:hypothetical protein
MQPERIGRSSGWFHMRNSEQYRQYARECDRLAQMARNPSQKTILHEMAFAWRALAEQAQRKEQNGHEPRQE